MRSSELYIKVMRVAILTVKIDHLSTEQINPKTKKIDQLDTREMLELVNNEDKLVAYAVEKEIPNIALVVDRVAFAHRQGGRLVYIGAGTSGRLGVLDASECPPTFGVDESMVMGLIAGGDQSLRTSSEASEDDETEAVKQLKEINFSASDVLVGIAASGRTPYVIGGLKYADKIGAFTAALSCSSNSLIGSIAKVAITPLVGPEVITGSTRLKAGTAEKMVLNMISTGAMIKNGKVFGNLMVNVQATNVKLCERIKKIVAQAAEVSVERASEVLNQVNYDTKLAIVVLKRNCTVAEAVRQLQEADGIISRVI